MNYILNSLIKPQIGYVSTYFRPEPAIRRVTKLVLNLLKKLFVVCFSAQLFLNTKGTFVLLMFATERDIQWFLEESSLFLLLL